MNDTAQKPSDQTVKPAVPVSSPTNREHEPSNFPDVSKMTESDIQKEEKELEKQIEAIVEESPNEKNPKVDEELKRIGVELTDEARVEPTFSKGTQPLPMSFDQAKDTRKKHNWRSSVSWLATLIMYHWKKLRTKEV